MPSTYGTLLLDLVRGHEVDDGIGQGRIVRMALVTDILIPSSVPTYDVVTRALQHPLLPNRGDRYPHSPYEEYFFKRKIGTAFNATTVGIQLIYEYSGQLVVRD